ncbi:unnamed protein product [Rotaria sordida]|uniref:Hint domain-containing protein n=1 Tax=Rotaria sordida TaxID=392033 RepID=A0A813NBM6_9BILA|nr:unnamed protein product [Rotaria sordida]CAF0814124.1 unnamed protein product [Rotaria sordida]
MLIFVEPYLKDRLLIPPSYDEATYRQQQIASSSYVPVNVGYITPSAPVTIDANSVQPQPTRHSYQGAVITGIIVGGVVIIALIVSLTFIFTRRSFVTTPTATTTTTKRPICFDGDGFLVKEGGSRVKIRDIKIGDQILVAYETAIQGVKLRSSPVLAVDIFQKYNNGSSVDFLEIQVESNVRFKPLHITPRHSLLVKKEHDVQVKYLFASQVQIGDYLYLVEDDYLSAIQARVTSIKNVQLFDAYAPLTLEGTLVVNDVVVSCYGTYVHSFVHLIMAPRRWLRYGTLQIVSSFMGPTYMKKYIDYLHNYFSTIDLFRLIILNRIRDFIHVFVSV